MKIFSETRGLIAKVQTYRPIKALFFLIVLEVILAWAVYLWKLLPLVGRVEPVAVHYSVQFGIDRLAAWYWTLLPPVLATLTFFLNSFFCLRLWRRERQELALAVAVYTVVLEALFFAGTFVLVLLNVGI